MSIQPVTAGFPANGSAPAETVSYVYGGNGRTTSVTDNRGTTTLVYENGCDRVSSVTDPVTGTTGYTYTVMGGKATMSLPGGGTWTYNYHQIPVLLPKDDPGSLTWPLVNIVDDQGRKVEFTMDFMGHPQTVKFNETYNGTNLTSYCETDYTYDADANYNGHHWLKQIKTTWNWLVGTTWNQSVLSQNAYTMDTAGQRLTNAVTDNTGTTRTEQYGYDEINRLTSVNYGDGQTRSYQFDPMGNRLQKADSVTGTENYGYNNANMLLTRGTNSYTNDADGNTLTGGGRTNSWDSENRMVQCVSGSNTSTYQYGADGYRHHSTVNGTSTDFALDGDSVVRELRAGTPYSTYLTGSSGPMYKLQNTNGTIRWYLYHGLGTVLGEVDPTGKVTTYAKYDVYGGVRSRTGTATSAHGFVGQLGHTSEAETSLVYMRARYMDPVVGRFVSQDPSCEGINWYCYAGGNPVNELDATGHATLGILDLFKLLDRLTGRNLAVFMDWLADLLASGLRGDARAALEAGARLKALQTCQIANESLDAGEAIAPILEDMEMNEGNTIRSLAARDAWKLQTIAWLRVTAELLDDD